MISLKPEPNIAKSAVSSAFSTNFPAYMSRKKQPSKPNLISTKTTGSLPKSYLNLPRPPIRSTKKKLSAISKKPMPTLPAISLSLHRPTYPDLRYRPPPSSSIFPVSNVSRFSCRRNRTARRQVPTASNIRSSNCFQLLPQNCTTYAKGVKLKAGSQLSLVMLIWSYCPNLANLPTMPVTLETSPVHHQVARCSGPVC